MRTARRGVLLLALSGFVLLAAGGCLFGAVEAPGEGAKAALRYQTCAPLIAALEQYHQLKRAYPDTLNPLTPDFLPALPADLAALEITYARTDASYTLQFRYTGPGVNRCSYTPETGWKCSGYY